MIKQGSSTAPLRKLSWAGLSAICGVAALLLPVVPTVGLAQEVEEVQEEKVEAPRVEVTETITEEGASAREVAEKIDVAEKIEANATVEDPHAAGQVIVEKSADGTVIRKIQVAPGNKKTYSEQLAEYVKRPGADNVSQELAKARAEIEHLRAQLKKAEYQLAMLQAHAGVPNFRVERKEWSDGKDGQGWTGKPPTVTLKAPAKQATSYDEREARLQKLEANLSMLLQEVKSLRDEKSGEGRTTEKLPEKMKSKPQPKEEQYDPKPARK